MQQSTSDFNKFNFLPSNRKPEIRSNLIMSIKKYGQVSPIIVDREFNIIDGQHRFLACRELGIPVEYIVKDVSEEVISQVNSLQKKWAMKDYLNRYLSLGRLDYVMLNNFMSLSGFGLEATLYLCRNGLRWGGDFNKRFREGDFRMTYEMRENFERNLPLINDLLSVSNGLFRKKFLQNRMFCALVRFINSAKYNHERMITLFETRVIYKRFIVTSSDEVNFEQLCDIYNQKLGAANRIFPKEMFSVKKQNGKQKEVVDE